MDPSDCLLDIPRPWSRWFNVCLPESLVLSAASAKGYHSNIETVGTNTGMSTGARIYSSGVHITDKLNWSTHTDSIVKKAQQRLFNLRRLKKFGLSPKALTNFYRCTIESILSGCITAWYGNCSAQNRKALQRVVRSAQHITGGKLPALQDTYTTRCHRKAIKIIKDNNHPSHCLFTPLSSRRRGQYRCIKAGTERLKNSFYLCLTAIRLLNSHH
uniref:Alkylated DNA repair protein AlkB homologue 8 N-terminal domain-containing protein n=1 Tax=Oncorhynchus tshawytscha TaxID=74940 RepID=A0AAZ3NTU4_ONCTS